MCPPGLRCDILSVAA